MFIRIYLPKISVQNQLSLVIIETKPHYFAPILKRYICELLIKVRIN